MVPGLGKKYKVEIETVSKPNRTIVPKNTPSWGCRWHRPSWWEMNRSVQGWDVDEDKLEAAICRHLGLPEPEPQKKGILDRLFK